MAPRSPLPPAPKSTCTLEIFAPAVGVTVNVTGTPALVAAGLALKPAMLRALTVTVAVPVSAPTVAMIFDVAVVVSVAVAFPLASVVAVDGEIDPLSTANVTGQPGSE